MEQNKALGILSIARKAGKIELGEEPVIALTRTGKARLVLVASDAGEHTKQKAQRLVAGTKQQLLTVPWATPRSPWPRSPTRLWPRRS